MSITTIVNQSALLLETIGFVDNLVKSGASEFKFRDLVLLPGGFSTHADALVPFRPDEAGPKIIVHFVRHAQGPHNLRAFMTGREARALQDPGLTALGVLQCATLCGVFERMGTVTHIVSSPCRRTIQTANFAFRPVFNRGAELHLLNCLKERGVNSCNNGSPIDILKREFKDLKLNTDSLPENWQTQFCDYGKGWEHVAIEIRKEIYQLGMKFLDKGEVNEEGNVEIVVVTHGGTLKTIDGTRGKPTDDDYTWNNTQHRAYHFFSSERAKTYKISPYQGLREYLTHSDFNTRKLLEKPLKVVDLENWGWRNQEIEQLSSFRERSLIEYRGLVKNRKTLMLTPNA